MDTARPREIERLSQDPDHALRDGRHPDASPPAGPRRAPGISAELSADPDLRDRFARVFPGEGVTPLGVACALAAYELALRRCEL